MTLQILGIGCFVEAPNPLGPGRAHAGCCESTLHLFSDPGAGLAHDLPVVHPTPGHKKSFAMRCRIYA